MPATAQVILSCKRVLAQHGPAPDHWAWELAMLCNIRAAGCGHLSWHRYLSTRTLNPGSVALQWHKGSLVERRQA